MDFSCKYISEEHQEQYRSTSESIDPSSMSQLVVSTTSPKSPRSSKSPKSPRSPRSPKGQSPKQSVSHGSPLKNQRQSHSRRGDGHPKKGGSGGKGTWGGLLDVEDDDFTNDPNDPNYVSDKEEPKPSIPRRNEKLEEFKKKATVIVEEYFDNDDVASTANELRDLSSPAYHYYFVKKLVSMAMDRRDKEKEMAALLLSSLYGDVIDPQQLYRGFQKLVESADDLIVDIPNAVDVLALFIARAIVDDILPPSFLTKTAAYLSGDSKGVEVMKRAEKGYLSAPLHSEGIERCWGGSKNSVEDLKARINDLLKEYVSSGDVKEAFRCVKGFNVPHFHHEIVKRSVVMAMENRQAEDRLLDLLKSASEEGLINSSQISKGFDRIIESIDDLSLDIPNAKSLLRTMISKAASEGWLCTSSLARQPERKPLEDDAARAFKSKSESIVREYFLTGNASEVRCRLDQSDRGRPFAPELNAIFVKKLITLAMDRKNREKEMASVLLSALCLPSEDVASGFAMLIESAEDTALDIPVVVEDLAMFLARAEVDEVLTPQDLREIGSQFSDPPGSVGDRVVRTARSLLGARLSGERILRCWGGGSGCTVEDVKDKIGKLLEEFETGGDVREACRCVKELNMPFFHHEVVKKSLVVLMENKDLKVWNLLRQCFEMQLVTSEQMGKGFSRVAESLDDLALDVPDAKRQFEGFVAMAKAEGWLDQSFGLGDNGGSASVQALENGVCV